MRRRNNRYIFCLLLGTMSTLSTFALPDPGKPFTITDFLRIVRSGHPMARQAELVRESARNQVLDARGAFDPQLTAGWENKRYDSKEYWRTFEGGLKVPTWFGIEAKAGYEQNSGSFLSETQRLPPNGLVYAGISVPVLQNTFTDERRTALRQAQIFRKSSDAERVAMLNDLYLNASKAYWEWMYAWMETAIYKDFVRLAEIRLDAIRTSYFRGANPGIDTVEALILLQSRKVGLDQATLELKAASLQLSNYLWTDTYVPLEVADSILQPTHPDSVSYPDALTADSLVKAIAGLDAHPDLIQKQLKLKWLEQERLLKLNKTLPKLNLNYNFLAEPVGINPASWNFNLFRNNFKYGIDFKFPVLIRSERAGLNLTKIKIQSGQLDLSQKRLEIQNKVRYYYNELFYYGNQVRMYRNIVRNYVTLMDAEEKKFSIGESSVFLLNSREIKLIESRIKLVELQSKLMKAFAAYEQSKGTLYQKVP